MTTPITVPADSGLLTDIVSFGLITPLNLGATSSAATTITTTNKFVPGINPLLGASNKSVIGTTATGWGELWSQGNAGAWASAGSAGAPTGHGFLYDSTALEGQTIIAGAWQTSARIQASAGTAIGVLLVRFYVYNSGTYTAIGSVTYGSATYGTGTQDSLGSASLSSQGFGVGDKLYIDFWFNVTTNSLTSSTDGLKIAGLTASTNPGSSHTAVITPGYVPTSLTLAASDSSTLTDTPSLFIQTPTTDAATLTDTPSLGTITPAASDSGSGADSPSIFAQSPESDTASGADAASLLIQPFPSDGGTGSDAPSFTNPITFALAESGAGGDQLANLQQLTVAPDAATGQDGVRQAAAPRIVTFITGP